MTKTAQRAGYWRSFCVIAFYVTMLAAFPINGTLLRAGPLYPPFTSATNGTWESVAASADGSKIVAVSNRRIGAVGGVYVSTNYGSNWNISYGANKDWEAVASSADGRKLVAAYGLPSTNGLVYLSTNSGMSWTPANISPPSGEWNSVSTSADGTKLAAVAVNVPAIYTSTNSGANWIPQTNGLVGPGFDYIACSADGNKLIAIGGGAGGVLLYTSTNAGTTWMQATNAPATIWYSVASSADGNQLLACSYFSGNVYLSTNAGVNWTQTHLPTNDWNSVASSADGTKLVALANSDSATLGVGNGGIWTSMDSGTTWASNNVESAAWTCAAMSADGNEIIAVIGFPSTTGGILVLQTTPSPVLNLAPMNGQYTLSWVIPSMDFTLQQSADLNSWLAVTNVPVPNLTNLENQVIFPPSGSNAFFRLKNP
jgi:hypothetical protein